MKNRFDSVLLCFSLVIAVAVLSGCHAAKGLGRDIKESSSSAGEKIMKADAWINEHMW